ncbi:MAG TPA: gamma-glutamyltransferase [Candidatus Sulfotelmatobacter sp.]|nr:gamma-glutamyltransferase [Candidatus Sulfotelmatobacter sp.]
MRDLQLPGRSVVHAVNGAAATSHPLSTMTAVDILRQGGTAADAAVAACAVQCVVEPMSTGIGGDCFVLYSRQGSGDVEGLNGSGRAPAGLTAERLLEQGIKQIGVQSAHAVTVPGAIDAWDTLLQKHGKFGLDKLLQPAIRYAEEGFAVTPRVAHDWKRNEAKLALDPSAAAKYLSGGKAPVAGDKHRLPALAETLKTIARQGRDGFYRGAVADDMVAHLERHGGYHTLDDFAEHRAEAVTPIATEYRGRQMLQIPPNGQGVTALLMFNILKGFDLAALDPVGVKRLHIEAETTRLAYAVRDKYVADPQHAPVPVEEILSQRFADDLRAQIDLERAMGSIDNTVGPIYRDTIYLTVVDKDRNVCSFINSLYFPFGSALVSEKTGVVLQNRGAGFRVQPGHPNCVAPRKRPLHTIIPGMALEGGRPVVAYGVMGGAYQPVGHVHVIGNMFDYGMDPQEALDCARVFHVEGRLDVERGVSDVVMAGLGALGHEVRRPDMPWGGGQLIKIDWDKGTLAAASDPRKDGCALGY